MIHLVASVITYDIWFYISHVILHKYLYKIHRIHHITEDLKWPDTYVAHWFESPFQGFGFLAPYLVYKYTWLDTLVILAFLNMRGIMRHDTRCVWLVGNHHILHHKHPEYNYGEGWIDSLIGTAYPRNYIKYT
jgi:sterol desaturase/sphingolipid hydroxylase (fatty acid hydroxylase superfamily)